MNLKTTVPLATAVVLGLVAAIVAGRLVKQRPVAVSADGSAPVLELSGVVVAARDIAPGEPLGGHHLRILRIESASVPANVATNPGALVRRVAKVQIPAGQMIHESMLAERGVAGGLPGVIAPGLRAMTIEVNEFTGLAGLIEPGHRVDVLARVAAGTGDGQMTRTIVQDVPVIAVGAQLTSRRASGEPEPAPPAAAPDAPAPTPPPMARSITVLVSPAEAEQIDLASATNGARIVLRASGDHATAPAGGATLATLRGDAPVAPPDVAPPEIAPVATRPPPSTPADDVFGPDARPAAAGPERPGVRSVTVIRAGTVSSVDIEERAVAEPQSASVE